MTIDAEQLALQKNNLYRDNYRRVMAFLLASVVITVSLLAVLSYQIITTPKPAYYATTTTGRVIPLQSLDMPVVTNTYLLQWAALATRAVYNLDFENYTKQLDNASSYFTPTGWESLTNAMKSSGAIDSLKNNKLFMAGIVNGPAVILDQEVVHGRYSWRVQLPLLVTYTSASIQQKAHFIITMDIIRVPVIDAAKSIQINRFSAVRG
ncbi:type IVB secretion system apparatus protein IcmL.2 [Coxiella burnetii]|uniref:IcmL n=2 Tax=Coxiella burnetii TaxID=777 RepID=Q83B83_COXBU|nr:type IVB secretion system apparatus protein IcmL.2 [Coxiella burnetii]NP_820612.1 Icm secretion system protein IcmL [Coxiella burnetii RSA 493]AAO91126.1 IcmL [Coxiella burnetii RSA 493]ABS76607.1 IcmL [Coxiella burnetii Dugway 5J108-111]ABX77322.1 IcmL protein [Coxiella burnetii RSA 331]ACJ17824.1 IcmL [Coxiella burnetii CbuG_Q212]ACJ20970.1 IcmL [Coxiella burnetii CbuK_Q154]